MSTFAAPVCRIDRVEAHPNADRLDLAVIGGYRSVIAKGSMSAGDLCVYIPESAIVPPALVRALGVEGKLAGSDKNRVKAIRLRGVLSQGLILPLPHGTLDGEPVEIGEDVAERLGLRKYVPQAPMHLSGETCPMHEWTWPYDIEDIKRYPDVLEPGEPVALTEKLHGTWCVLGHHPQAPSPIVASKGLSARGLGFKVDGEANASNVYVRIYHVVRPMLEALARRYARPGHGVYLLGEIVGPKIQDLVYARSQPTFFAFDIACGPGRGAMIYLAPDEMSAACRAFGIDTVPELARGPWSPSLIAEYVDGHTTMEGASHIREGVVIRPLTERRDDALGRVILKAINERYLTRRHGTEYE